MPDHACVVVRIDGTRRPAPADITRRPPAPADVTARDLQQAFDRLSTALGSDFQAARTLVGMVESAAARMNELDRLQLGRLTVSAGHSITLTCRERPR